MMMMMMNNQIKPSQPQSMETLIMMMTAHHLPLPLPGMGNRRRRNRKSRLSTQHQAETRSSSTEVETCVRTVQLRSSPSPARSPSVQVTRSPSVQVTSVHTRVGTSRSKADRSRSPLRGNMGRNQQRREVGRSKSRSREGELPRRRSRASSRDSRAGKVQPPKQHISQACSEKQRPAPTAGTTDQSTTINDQPLPTYQDLVVHIAARRVHDLQAALMTCPASFRRNLEDQLASANLALRERHNHRQSHLVLTTQALVLRGEENRQFPLEVPLWTQHLGPSSTFLAPVPVSSAQKQRK